MLNPLALMVDVLTHESHYIKAGRNQNHSTAMPRMHVLSSRTTPTAVSAQPKAGNTHLSQGEQPAFLALHALTHKRANLEGNSADVRASLLQGLE